MDAFLPSGISLRQLHYLVAVADAGSFSAAAEHTHVAQPALSRQIALLESQVEMRLMHRSRSGVVLTDSGTRLYNLARDILARLGNLQMELRSSQTKPAGVVRVAMPPSVASMLVSPLVRELQRRYPEIILQIEDGLSLENGRSVESALLDFGIVATADELLDVEYESLVQESLMLIERRSGSRRMPATVTFNQVAKIKLVLPSRNFHIRRVIDKIAHASNLKLIIGFEQQSLPTIVSMVGDGIAATIMNTPSILRYWPPGSICARRIVKPEIMRTISLARPAKRSLSFAAEAVYEVVKRLAIEAVKDGRWQGKPAF